MTYYFKNFTCALVLALFTHNISSKITPELTIQDVSQVTKGTVKAIITPKTIDELRTTILTTQGPFAIKGGGFSQGGHIWYNHGTVIDMTRLTKVTAFDISNKTITVEAGITWRQLQQFIQQSGLSVTVMQSYNDFSVGGSVAVNVHGRDIAYGPLVDSIIALKLLLADGSLVTASRNQNYDLFKMACGGYGAGAIITEVTLKLTDNIPLECSMQPMSFAHYKEFFFSEIYKKPNVALHNANLYPNEYDQVVAVTWKPTTKPLTEQQPLQKFKKIHAKEGIAGILLRYIPWLKRFRLPLETKTALVSPANDPVVWRNYEMSSTVASLEPISRSITTPVLQEYFVPFDALEDFVTVLRTTTKEYNINVLNVSIRYVPQNNDSWLAYAKKECFALVLFINFPNTKAGYNHTKEWTRTLIDHTLALGGTYYLPYQLFARQDQFERAYPDHALFKELRTKYDPNALFSNTFLKKYLS